jgi:hypothetical protein
MSKLNFTLLQVVLRIVGMKKMASRYGMTVWFSDHNFFPFLFAPIWELAPTFGA